MSEGFDFLGFRIQWRRKRGTNKWYVYTFIADRPIRSVKAKIRALTNRTSQQATWGRADPAQPDHARLGQLLQARRRASTPSSTPAPLRVVAGGPLADDAAPLEVEGRPPTAHRPHRAVASPSRRTGSNCSTSPRSRSPATATGATRSPPPGPPDEPRLTAETVESPVRESSHGGFGERPGETDRWQPGTAPQADSTVTRRNLRRGSGVAHTSSCQAARGLDRSSRVDMSSLTSP